MIFVVCCLLFVCLFVCLLFVCLLFVVCCLLFVVCCLFAVCCFSFKRARMEEKLLNMDAAYRQLQTDMKINEEKYNELNQQYVIQ